MWKNNEVQFARLLCELVAADYNVTDAAKSMDLDVKDINELLDRAHEVFEKAKVDGPPRDGEGVAVNVDNLSAVSESGHYTLPEKGPPRVVRVNTHYSLYRRYSIWDPKVLNWWRDKKDARRTWSRPETAEKAVQAKLAEELDDLLEK